MKTPTPKKRTAKPKTKKVTFKVALVAVTTSAKWKLIQADAEREQMPVMQHVKKLLAATEYGRVKIEYDRHDDTVNLLWTGKA